MNAGIKVSIPKQLNVLTAILCSTLLQAQNIPVVEFPELEQLYMKNNDTTYVVNFWATWCKPCIEELPHFKKINVDLDSQKMEMLLVSLDFVDKIDSKLIPFIEENHLKPRVIVINDPKENEWIPRVNEIWSGALPATLIINNAKGYRFFYEGKLGYKTLRNAVLTALSR